MMQRKRAFFALLTALMLVVVACSGDEPVAETTTTTAAPSGGGDATTTTTAATPDTTEAPDLAGTSVTIFGPESSDEEAGAFQDALDIFVDETGINVTYVGARDFSDQINAQVAGGNPPDIAIYPQPGKLADFARQGAIFPLPADVDAASAAAWSDAFRAFGNVDGTQYGVPIKADLKSLVWYQPSAFEAAGYAIPETWDDLKALSNEMIADGNTPWCVGIESGGATGWPFTDWVEDLMLRFEGADVYDQWVGHEIPFNDERVLAVWNEVLDLWNTPGAVFAADGSIAATAFGNNGQPLVDGDCFMHRQASFYAAFIPAGTAFADGSEGAVDVFYFPSVTGDRPVLGAGTLAAAHSDRPEVWAVMAYLAGADYATARQAAQQQRKIDPANPDVIPLSGFLSAASGQDMSVYVPLEQSFLDILASAEVFRFDGSDLMPAAVGAGTFWTEATAAVNGDKSAQEAVDAIEASWPAS